MHRSDSAANGSTIGCQLAVISGEGFASDNDAFHTRIIWQLRVDLIYRSQCRIAIEAGAHTDHGGQLVIRITEHRCVCNRKLVEQFRFNPLGMNIATPASDDQILTAALDMDKALAINAADIASGEPVMVTRRIAPSIKISLVQKKGGLPLIGRPPEFHCDDLTVRMIFIPARLSAPNN